MLCFAGGALPLVMASETGWNPALFRLFYLLGGVVTVPVLALGTVYLVTPRRLADRVSLAVALFGAFATGVVLTAPLRGPLHADQLNEGREVFGVLPRVLAASASGLGALVVVVGALISGFGLLRAAGRQAAGAALANLPATTNTVGVGTIGARRLASANALVAVGTLLVSAKRPFVALSGSDEVGFAAALACGLAVIFAGFLIATAAARSPTPAPSTTPSTPSAHPA